MKFCEHQLDNGLEIVAEVNPDAYSTSLGYFVKTGSRDETADVAGVSHFLEHMLFKGTPRRSAADVNRELDEIGSHANAYTSEERTVYYATVLPEYQARAVEILSDMMRPALREDDFETEKKVIIEEICKYEDQPPFGAHEKAMAAYFASHPMGNNVLGTVESVSALTPQAMRAYFDQRYSPANITLVSAGNVDFDQLCADVEKYCGQWEPKDALRDTPPASARTKFEVITKELATQEYVVQIAPGPATESDERFAARLLATIVGDDSGSRLYWEMIETGLAETAAIWPYEFQGTGIFMTFLSCAPEQTAANLQCILDVQKQVEQHGVTEDELELAKTKICSSLVIRSERPASRLSAVGSGWIGRHEYRTVRQIVDAFRAVTLDDVAGILKKYPLTQNTTVAVGPLTQLEPPK